MKAVSVVVGALGVLVVLAGVVGRLKGTPLVWVWGHAHTASAVILLGNSLLLIGIWLGLLSGAKKD